MSKILVCGSREFDDIEKLYNALDDILAKFNDPIIIQGGCKGVKGGPKGADLLTKEYAQEKNIPFIEVKPEWKYGKRAGPIRNTKMIQMEPECVVAFSSKDDFTKGTLDTVTKARSKGITVYPFLNSLGPLVQENSNLPDILKCYAN
jgi:hypothetical protein